MFARIARVLLVPLGLGAPPLRANDLPTTVEIIQAGIDEAARELGKDPKLRHRRVAR